MKQLVQGSFDGSVPRRKNKKHTFVTEKQTEIGQFKTDRMTKNMQSIMPTLTRWLTAIVGIIWCHIEPSINFMIICIFAHLVDCLTAWRLNRRIRRQYSKEVADGKLKSSHMSKMIVDLSVVFLCIILADVVDGILLAHWGGIHLANYIAAVFCLVQFVSILENESSCNGATWAIVAQKILADKTARHLDIDISEFDELKRKQEEKDNSGIPPKSFV